MTGVFTDEGPSLRRNYARLFGDLTECAHNISVFKHKGNFVCPRTCRGQIGPDGAHSESFLDETDDVQ